MNKITVNDCITIFGGGGFLGNYIVRLLAPTGARIRIASRFPNQNQALKVAGYVGQISLEQCDAKDAKQVERMIQNSTYVINLIGILFPTSGQSFDTMHHTIAHNIAALCAQYEVKRLVHVSALGIDKASNSSYASSKLQGETEALKSFSRTIALRPSVMFGEEDNFINMFNRFSKISPFLPLIGGGENLFQPVYVNDVAMVAYKCLTEAESRVCGKIFELGGPNTYSMREIMELILEISKRKRFLVSVPSWFAKLKAFFLEFLPYPPLTRDQVELLHSDNIVTGKNGLDVLGIAPTPMPPIISKYIN